MGLWQDKWAAKIKAEGSSVVTINTSSSGPTSPTRPTCNACAMLGRGARSSPRMDLSAASLG